MIQWIRPDRAETEVVLIGTEFEDERRVEAPMALVLHDGSKNAVIPGTREEIVALLMEAIVAVKGWEPEFKHDWVISDENVRCRACKVRIEPDSVARMSFPCEPAVGRYEIPHLWRWVDKSEPDRSAHSWECMICETHDHQEPCTPTD